MARAWEKKIKTVEYVLGLRRGWHYHCWARMLEITLQFDHRLLGPFFFFLPHAYLHSYSYKLIYILSHSLFDFSGEYQANLRTKKTHSTQTDKSNYRRDNSVQVFPPK